MSQTETASSDQDFSGEEPIDYRALADFRYAIRRFLAFSEIAALEAGLTAQQQQALLTIKGLGGSGGLPVGALGERLLIRHHSAVELVDRLERAGLVRRGPDPADRRRVLVALTPEGEKSLRRLSAVHLAELRSIRLELISVLMGLQEQPKNDTPGPENRNPPGK
jgi:DNA-binding MarR family transcriptional regulator